MTTCLVGTDGLPASEAICDFLESEVDRLDHVEVINAPAQGDVDAATEGKEALELFEERFGDRVAVETHQRVRGKDPSDELLERAGEIGADRILVGLRRHSRTERIIFGSVSRTLLEKVTVPVTLVPLPEYQPAE